MKILIVGTVPPPGGPRALLLGTLAATHLENGDIVEVVSPDARSSAHVTEHLGGLRLVTRLVAAARRCDAVVLRIERGLPFAGDESRAWRAVLCYALGYALGRFSQVTIRLDSPIAIPHGIGGRPTRGLWARAEVVVENEQDRDRVVTAGVVPVERVTVVEVPRALRACSSRPWPTEQALDPRPAVLAVVRERASESRAVAVAVGDRFAPEAAALSPFEASATPLRTSSIAFSALAARKVARRLAGIARRI